MPETAESLATRVGAIAAGPASATNPDGSSVTQQSVADAIRAQQFVEARANANAGRLPFQFVRARNPGAHE